MFSLKYLVMALMVSRTSSLAWPPDCGCLAQAVGQVKGSQHCGEDMACACRSGLVSGAKHCADTCKEESASSSIVAWVSSVCAATSMLNSVSSPIMNSVFTMPTARTNIPHTPWSSDTVASPTTQANSSNSGTVSDLPNVSAATVATTFSTMQSSPRDTAIASTTIPPSPSPFPEKSPSGISDTAKIGIGVSLSLAGICAIVACCGIYLARKRAASKGTIETPAEENKWEKNGIIFQSEANCVHEIDGAEVRAWELDARELDATKKETDTTVHEKM